MKHQAPLMVLLGAVFFLLLPWAAAQDGNAGDENVLEPNPPLDENAPDIDELPLDFVRLDPALEELVSLTAQGQDTDALVENNGLSVRDGRVKVDVFLFEALSVEALGENVQQVGGGQGLGFFTLWVPIDELEALSQRKEVAQVFVSFARDDIEGFDDFPPGLDAALSQLYQADQNGSDIAEILELYGLEVENGKVHVVLLFDSEQGALEELTLLEVEEQQSQVGFTQASGWVQITELLNLAGSDGVRNLAPYAPLPLTPAALFAGKASEKLQGLVGVFKEGGNLQAFASENGLDLIGDRVRLSVTVAAGTDLVNAFPGFQRERVAGLPDTEVVGSLEISKLEDLAALGAVERLDAAAPKPSAQAPETPPIRPVPAPSGQPDIVLPGILFIIGIGLILVYLIRRRNF